MQKQTLILTVILILQLTFCIENCYSQWEPDVRLTNAAGNSFLSYSDRFVVASGNIIHVVWFDDRDGNNEVYYKFSTDCGVNWATDIRLTNDPSFSLYPSIAVSGSFLHLLWNDYRDGNPEIYYKRSTDCGISWGADTRLTNDPRSSSFPCIAVSGSHVHVVWYDDRDNNREIYYKHSSDNGINWGADIRLTNNSSYSEKPAITVSGSFVNVVWDDDRDGNMEIYYKRSTNNGLNWGTDTRLTNSPASSVEPSIAISGSFVHIVWCDYRDGNWEIYYKHSSDDGINWGVDKRLTNAPASSAHPSIAAAGSLVHFVWYDHPEGYYKIYYKRSTDNGITWEADTRLTDHTFGCGYPSIAVSGSFLHVVWEDYRNGGNNGEIYYKRNPTGNSVGIQNYYDEIPSAYILEQNYPNPFNATTKIKFDIPAKDQLIGVNDNVMLKVYNIYGSEVATVVNEVLPPGKYELPFDASLLPGGIYFYQLQTKDFVATKQMILVK